ncbi:hypothetical protein TW95_gp0435 [Pandoravirus inopinatum]|uniref:Uncharacterized protein n=1 Tax=Pandoravirus inopinatum TaxID=1605721 RepID=A0A0B5J150_9VIRU|nr:hypothetical protein TW95_gp0435 [Pandoravirus inopinatum]AJF97169.1 hypothetical protein [Pandoravirus inopinatum]
MACMDACSLWAGGPRLGDMPTEMIDVIASHLARARDAVSYYVALGQSPTRALTERVLADPVAFLAAGAPLDITQTLLDRMRTGVPVPFDWVEAAVYGGQQGVITTVWTRASVDTAADLYRFEWRRVGRGRGGASLVRRDAFWRPPSTVAEVPTLSVTFWTYTTRRALTRVPSLTKACLVGCVATPSNTGPMPSP